MTETRRYQSLGATYTLDLMEPSGPLPWTPAALECQASAKASSAWVPNQTATITSAPPRWPLRSSMLYHCGASGLSGGARRGTSERSNQTRPTWSSQPRARTYTSKNEDWMASLEKANTWSQLWAGAAGVTPR
uniref:Uncharacterized protein n=1 Tax=Arundo donax TaxID=35708 RepID=A0A0A9CWY1_ARUDO